MGATSDIEAEECRVAPAVGDDDRWLFRKSNHVALMTLAFLDSAMFIGLFAYLTYMAGEPLFKFLIILVLGIVVGVFLFSMSVMGKKLNHGIQYRCIHRPPDAAARAGREALKLEGVKFDDMKNVEMWAIPLLARRRFRRCLQTDLGFSVRFYGAEDISVVEIGPQSLDNNGLIQRIKIAIDKEDRKNTASGNARAALSGLDSVTTLVVKEDEGSSDHALATGRNKVGNNRTGKVKDRKEGKSVKSGK